MVELGTSQYRTVHIWVERQLGKPSKCAHCGIDKVTIKYQWANISGQYLREISDWIRLCIPCHRKFDYRNKCRKGHEMSDDNVYANPKSGQRECLRCKRERKKQRQLLGMGKAS